MTPMSLAWVLTMARARARTSMHSGEPFQYDGSHSSDLGVIISKESLYPLTQAHTHQKDFAQQYG